MVLVVGVVFDISNREHWDTSCGNEHSVDGGTGSRRCSEESELSASVLQGYGHFGSVVLRADLNVQIHFFKESLLIGDMNSQLVDVAIDNSNRNRFGF